MFIFHCYIFLNLNKLKVTNKFLNKKKKKKSKTHVSKLKKFLNLTEKKRKGPRIIVTNLEIDGALERGL